MISRRTNNEKVGGSWMGILLFVLALLFVSAVPARADNCVADWGGVIDGNVTPVPPSQIQIDGNCTFRNYPVSNPLTINISFFTNPGNNNQRWLVIFDNVDFIGNMACDAVQGNHIWFVNGSFTTLKANCQNLFIPVEKIDKANPPGQTTAAIGVPFTYKLTIPVLYDSSSGTVINNAGSPNDLHSIVVTDDLNATGAVLSYVSYKAYWKATGTPLSPTFSNVGGVLTFSNFPIIPAGQQIVIEITVVLNNDPANTPGTQFTNTAKWEFGRLIDGVFYQPLPGEWGISPPMTIAAPNLVLTKSGPATMSTGQWGQFGLNVQNTGLSDAWNVTLLDRLPSSATGGMCNTTPQVLSAQVFQSDGVTPVAGKGPLVAGTDFSISYAGAPTCALTLTTLTAAGAIGPSQRLIISYRTQLDANTQNGATLTNIAGATQWFNGDSSVSTRQAFTRTLTDGTPGVLDFQDAHTVTAVITTLTITKQVSVVGGGAATPGGQLDYLLHVTNVSTNPATPVVITDDVGTASAGRLTIVAASATMNGSAAGISIVGSVLTADYSTAYGVLQPGQSIDVRFRAQIASGLSSGTTLTNTGIVTWNSPPQTASATVSVDIGGVPGLSITKTVTVVGGGAAMSGGQLDYLVHVTNVSMNPASPVAITDDLGTASAGRLTFVAQSATMNGSTAGISIAGSVLTADFSSAYGQLQPGQSIDVRFRAQIASGLSSGTTLTNTGVVTWNNPPLTASATVSIDIGEIAGLTITKTVTVVGGGTALAGGQLDYLVHVTNVSMNPASPVVITDDMGTASGGRLTFVAQSATMNGSTAGVSVAGSLLTADYSSVYGLLQPGQSIDVRFRAQIASGLSAGTTLTNTGVVTWNSPPLTASATVSVDIGGIPGIGSLNGTAWLDANFNKVADADEPRLQGWTVALYRNATLVQSVLTDVSGVYRFANVQPTNGTTDRYEVRFTAPGAGPNTAKLGKADSAFTNALQRITDIAVPSGSSLQNLNLPIGPNGVVYSSMTRAPIAGAILNLLRTGSRTPLPTGCFDDPGQQGQITQAGGYYRFDINFSDASCPSGATYYIDVTVPGSTYVAGESQEIPPASNASTAPFSVPACPGSSQDALPGVPYCEVQVSALSPQASVVARSAGTRYYLNLTLDGSAAPGSSQIYNNHIPLDPQLAGAFSITKTTPLLNVNRGQLVPYTITISNVIGAAIQGARVVDRYPAGFRYVPGSARLDGVATEPTAAAGELVWDGINFGTTGHRTIVLLLVVGGGVGEGEFVNRAQVVESLSGRAISGEASARVRVIPDLTFDCTDVFGKVFNDVNGNGHQDSGEKGLPGVRVVTARGLEAVTDQYGRFHITCAITPNDSRGSNFVLKLDDRTLPSGFRMLTNPLQIKHATRGKALKFDFGAAIGRVVGIDLSDEVFEPGTTEIRAQWRPRINTLLEELRKAPSVLRLSYVADTEDAALVGRRMEAVQRQLTEAWDSASSTYALTIEPEVFWRRGAPPKRPDVRVPKSR